MNAFTPPPPQPPARERAINAPPAVLWLIGVLAAVHAGRILAGPETDLEIVLRLAFIPARYADPDGVPAGALVVAVLPAFGHMFLHGDLVHLAINSLWLLAFGAPVAQRMGWAGFLLFFVICGLGGAAAHLATNWGSAVPMIGASGAISGIMAAALRLVFGGEGPAAAGFGRPAPVFSPKFLSITAIWLGTNALFGLYGGALVGEGQGIAWEAHVGGYAAGALLLGVFPRQRGPALPYS